MWHESPHHLYRYSISIHIVIISNKPYRFSQSRSNKKSSKYLHTQKRILQVPKKKHPAPIVPNRPESSGSPHGQAPHQRAGPLQRPGRRGAGVALHRRLRGGRRGHLGGHLEPAVARWVSTTDGAHRESCGGLRCEKNWEKWWKNVDLHGCTMIYPFLNW